MVTRSFTRWLMWFALATLMVGLVSCKRNESQPQGAASPIGGAVIARAEGSVQPITAGTPALGETAATVAPSASAARSPSPAARAQTGPFNPCNVLTKEEVEAATGFSSLTVTPYGVTERTTQTQVSSCEYEGRGGRVSTIMFQSSLARMEIANRRKDARGPIQDVSGIGDQAFFAGGGREMFVQRGDVFFSIEGGDSTGVTTAEQWQAKMLTLARTALARLQQARIPAEAVHSSQFSQTRTPTVNCEL